MTAGYVEVKNCATDSMNVALVLPGESGTKDVL
jgi:hypothetical protein